MAGTMSAVAAVNGSKMSSSTYNLTALKRWSITNKHLPNVDSISNIHVYDFDNTLFASPLPNRQLWAPAAIGLLQGKDVFLGGGWWHDPEVLAMTGEGIDKEEPRGWQGWWNEEIVKLVRLSMQQSDALTVLLTGRAQDSFSELILRIVKSRGLDFDLVCLKPEVGPTNENFTSTMKYKQAFLACLAHTYHKADEMRIYEDRLAHVEQFRTFFADFNSKYPSDPSQDAQSPRNKPINTEVVEVFCLDTKLDPEVECLRVREMARLHNEQVKAGNSVAKKPSLWTVVKQVHFTAYLIDSKDGERLLQMAGLESYKKRDGLVRFANSVVITARAKVPQNVMERVGGMKAKLRWKVIALGNYENKVFAARLQPVPVTSPFQVEAPVPHVVLATTGFPAKAVDGNRIQTWNNVPDHDMIEFETTVGEKATLRLEEERVSGGNNNNNDNSNNNSGKNGNGKRARPSDGDHNFPALPKSGNNRRESGHGGGQARGFSSAAGGNRSGNRGGHKNDGGKGGGGGNHNRQGGKGGPPRGPSGAGKKGGRGNFANYRSLDDVGAGGGTSFGTDGANDDGGLSY